MSSNLDNPSHKSHEMHQANLVDCVRQKINSCLYLFESSLCVLWQIIPHFLIAYKKYLQSKQPLFVCASYALLHSSHIVCCLLLGPSVCIEIYTPIVSPIPVRVVYHRIILLLISMITTQEIHPMLLLLPHCARSTALHFMMMII